MKKYIKNDTIKTPLKVRMKSRYLIEIFGGLPMPTRIAILGGPRCGKTTLIQQLYVDLKIRDLDVGVATEYSTDYLRDKGMIESKNNVKATG